MNQDMAAKGYGKVEYQALDESHLLLIYQPDERLSHVRPRPLPSEKPESCTNVTNWLKLDSLIPEVREWAEQIQQSLEYDAAQNN